MAGTTFPCYYYYAFYVISWVKRKNKIPIVKHPSHHNTLEYTWHFLFFFILERYECKEYYVIEYLITIKYAQV